MQCKWIVFIGLFIFSTITMAYELNGTMTANGNGTYSVNLQNLDGHHFYGTAKDQDDGSLSMVVQDERGIRYVGTATANGDEYDIELEDPATGNFAQGTVDADE